MNIILANQNCTKYDKLIREEFNCVKHLIGYYCKLLKIDETSNILNEAHTVLKGHLNGRSTSNLSKLFFTGTVLIYY